MSQTPSIDEKSSCILWMTSGRRHVWRGGDLGGAVWASDDPAAPGMTVLFEWPAHATVRLQLGAIEYQPTGAGPRQTQPAPKDFFVQQPYLVCPQEVASSVGLCARAQILVEEGGAILDIELETIEPLDFVEFDGRIDLAGVSLATAAHGQADRDQMRCCELVRDNVTVGALLCELGEQGCAEFAAGRLHLRWFRQPLEKGVILVGRLGVVTRSTEPPDAFLQRCRGWLERPTFL